MPELPEVETIALDLKGILKDQKISGFKVLKKKSLANFNPDELAEKIKNKKISEIYRKAKYIIFSLSNNSFLVVHLRMTGQLIASEKNPKTSKHLCWMINFKNFDLHFNDIRRFGKLWFFEKQKQLEDFFQEKNLGPEPLGSDFTEKKLLEMLKEKKQNMKAFLLDQSNISGIGNIYANEILWEAQIHPASQTSSIQAKQNGILFQTIKKILRLAIEKRGTSISDFRDALGVEGEFQNYLCVHQKEGFLCPKCHTKIKKIKIAQRGTYFCPKCQKINK